MLLLLLLLMQVRFLRVALDASVEDVRHITLRYPSMFNLDVQANLGPKIELFVNAFTGTRADVRKVLLTSPQILGYSVDNRIVPRLKAMQEAGIQPVWELHHWNVVRRCSQFVEYASCPYK
jgi:mTERF